MNGANETEKTTSLPAKRRVVMVTGPSGAGRSSALNVLEDAGFEAIDNLPLRLLPTLLDGPGEHRPVALGIDARTRDFSTDAVMDILARLSDRSDLSVELLFLDCSAEVLLRRFSETRRRHPIAEGGPPSVGIDREIALLSPLKARADVLIDTSSLNVHDLRAEVERWFAPDGKHHLSVSIQSFSYKRGLPRSVDMVYDCRFLRNPHWDASLRDANGKDARVAAFVAEDPRYAPFAEQVLELSKLLLPAFREEGKSNISIAFGCTGGQHRSVALAEEHALRLAQLGWQVSIRHRELERQHEG
ncbi:RNase adapter RapZ [Sulfitobacter sp. JBTF-M27]|uniref:RNase adapter RapZ n=1 Tax=Sulfitobacter sediminilitoris TaxID=2698830 RepID=A0A6P0CF21_9RHOB|nr:RNase adapter RapZ [Sulfitobacter sediminilitoris]NEK23024.1 RNase adapter RapZ [Sulfitobacter sediminilitoris]